MVKRAEQLAHTHPDSAARLIDSVLRMPASFSERERMDMALLQAEALFGYRDVSGNVPTISPVMDEDFFDDHTNLYTSPELERAAAYFAKKKQYAKAAKTALYSGYVQQHYNNKDVAMRSFKEAEQYGTISGDSLIVAQAQYWMGKTLFGEGMVQEALVMLKNAENGFGFQSAEKAVTQNMLAVCNMVIGDYESAEDCLQQSLAYAENNHIDKIKSKALNNYAVLYRRQGKFDLAVDCLRRIAEELQHDDTEMFMYYLNMGKTFMVTNDLDSASMYFQYIENAVSNANLKNDTKVSAYDALFRLAANANQDTMALRYHELFGLQLFQVMQQRQEQNTYRIQKQYDYENIQNALNRKIIFKHKIILIISILLFISVVVIMVLQHRQKKMREAEAEMKKQIETLKTNLSESTKASYLEQELSSRIRLIVSAYRTQKRANDPKNDWTPLVFRLMNGKTSFFEAIADEIEKAYPKIRTILQQKYPELNETETKVCLLSFTDLSNAEMAEILGISINTVNKNRSKVRNKLNLKPEKMKKQLNKVLSE